MARGLYLRVPLQQTCVPKKGFYNRKARLIFFVHTITQSDSMRKNYASFSEQTHAKPLTIGRLQGITFDYRKFPWKNR